MTKKKEYVAPLETNNEGKNLWKVAREKAQTKQPNLAPHSLFILLCLNLVYILVSSESM